jgi:hypothetical protein
MVTLTYLEPTNWYLQLAPQAGQSSRLTQVIVNVIPDGFSTTVLIEHRMRISAADLAAGFPTIEIVNPSNNPTIPYVPTLVTHTTLTGAAASLGVTVQASLTGSLILAFATPAFAANVGPTSAAFMVVITRNPASVIPAP